MSKTYGVAKRARAIAVKIDRNGKPSSAYVLVYTIKCKGLLWPCMHACSLAIAAFNWVKKHHKRRKSVAKWVIKINFTHTKLRLVLCYNCSASFHVSGRGVNAAATALVKSVNITQLTHNAYLIKIISNYNVLNMQGVPLVAAAGNSKKNACKSNPASAKRV